MSDGPAESSSTQKRLINALEGIENDSAQKMLDYVRGNVSESELSFEDWTEPLKLNTEIWLILFDTKSGHMSWMHYEESTEDLCIHPANDWTPHEVNEAPFIDAINESDSKIEIDVQHRDKTPVNPSIHAERDKDTA